MQYKCIAESSNVKIFERDKFYENTWHCVAKIDHGNLRFSKLTDSEQQKEILRLIPD